MGFLSDNEIKVFFDYKKEKKWERAILSREFAEIRNEVWQYAQEILETPIAIYMQYISQVGKRQPILAADVFQFSDFNDATINLCNGIRSINNPGIGFRDVAMLLLQDGVVRKEGALNKYGENHIKTAELLGLAFKDEHKTYYLSAIGCVFSELSEEDQKKLLVRLLLRNKLISQLFIASYDGVFDLEAFLYDLSRSTYLRRRTNINCVIKFLNQSKEFDFAQITKNINY